MSQKYLGPLNNFKNMYIFLYSNRKSLFKEFKWVWTQMRFRLETLTCEIRERSALPARPSLPLRVSTSDRAVSRNAWAAAREATARVPPLLVRARPGALWPPRSRGVRLGGGPVATFPTSLAPSSRSHRLLPVQAVPSSSAGVPSVWSLLAPTRGGCHCFLILT